MIDMNAIRERYDKATHAQHVDAGVWKTAHGFIPYVAQTAQRDTYEGGIQAWYDAEFLAHAYEDIPALLAALAAAEAENERRLILIAKPCYDCPVPEKRQYFHRTWEEIDARLAAAEARAEQVEAKARALVEVAYSEEGDMGVRWYAVDAEYVDALAKVFGIEKPGDLGGEGEP